MSKVFRGLRIDWRPFYTCNFACSYCYLVRQGLNKHRGGERENIELFNRLDIRDSRITISGGEPSLFFTRKDFGLYWQRNNEVCIVTNLTADVEYYCGLEVSASFHWEYFSWKEFKEKLLAVKKVAKSVEVTVVLLSVDELGGFERIYKELRDVGIKAFLSPDVDKVWQDDELYALLFFVHKGLHPFEFGRLSNRTGFPMIKSPLLHKVCSLKTVVIEVDGSVRKCWGMEPYCSLSDFREPSEVVCEYLCGCWIPTEIEEKFGWEDD